ncbi:MAG TPA: thioesterase family protein [Mesorhizobium sp.]|jgi:acyl-CoA thioester hydrolase
MAIEPQWTDYNGHMNMAYYNVLFDRCVDQACDLLGIGAAYAKTRRLTIYTAEVHVCYVRELHQHQSVTVSLQVLDHDAKRLHLYQEVRHEDGWLAATSESLVLHIDMSGPKVAPFPEDILPNVEEMARAHTDLPAPERAGRRIGIERRT